ncbi:MerR family transcriptional regulator [Bordetella avium]|nr:MerR family transcriptional regulator [Bordetella avium]RIQ39921.1 MerR family transcriptional regulator [Bordetella avium]RIQ44720.1 MerR family transcriptional regulator [Bordetella avium]RIQ45061.1 MerR family transcriptional regulator [Bordetella avium]RIQ47688.1 MerR family transcriptional regulator [Bordetella avium]
MEDVVNSVRRYRSGEAAKLADMPAATLRIWEQRYGVVSPPTSASGQRQYSEADVQRLRLIKSLVDRGHTISAIAHLGLDQLKQLLNSAEAAPRHKPRGLNLYLIGFDLNALPELPDGLSCFPLTTLEDSFPAPNDRDASNCLIVRVEALHEDTVFAIAAAARRADCARVLVVYAFGSRQASKLARIEKLDLKRAPQALLQAQDIISEYLGLIHPSPAPTRDPIRLRSPRRFDNETLVSLASHSTSLACECPRHLAELLLQISAFERYSDGCQARSPADARLHNYLGDAANQAAALFEDALAAVVEHEGWSLSDIKQGRG